MLSLRTKHKSAKPVSKCQVLFITVGDPRCLEKVGAMYLPHPKFLGGLLQQKQVLSQILRIVPQWLVNRLRNSWKLMGKVSGHHAHRLLGGGGPQIPWDMRRCGPAPNTAWPAGFPTSGQGAGG